MIYQIRNSQTPTHLRHVKDLDTIALKLAADDHVVVVRSDFCPVGSIRNRGKLWSLYCQYYDSYNTTSLSKDIMPVRVGELTGNRGAACVLLVRFR